MQNNKIVRGDDLMIFNSKKQSIAFATSHALTLSGEASDIATKDSGAWKESRINKLGWEITSDNLYCETKFNELFDLWIAREPVEVYFGLATRNDLGIDSPDEWFAPQEGKFYKGKALITSVNVNAASGDNATYSITLQGVGAFKNPAQIAEEEAAKQAATVQTKQAKA